MSSAHELTGRVLRILLIEDSEDDAFLVERHLRLAGFAPSLFRVETAEAMVEALGEPREVSPWDLILADYNLPAFSALDALDLLKSSGSDIPFIVLSGAVSEETAVSAMRAGAQDYVSKQNLARLAPAIEREWGEAQMRRERRSVDNALQASEQRFHRLVDAMPLGLLISDFTGRLLYTNSAVERLLDLSPDEVRSGSVMLDSILERSASFLLSVGSGSAEEFRTQHLSPFETECVTRRGETVPLLVGVAVLNPEAPVGDRQIAAFLADLTEQKRSQEVVRRTEKLAATGRLAASIAHEINNPLEAVTNCLYLLEQANLDATSKSYLEMAQRELDRVVQITTQTLRFYRQNTRPSETNVHELLETVLALYEVRMRTFGIEVIRHFGAIPRVTVYDGEIRQILANLVGNAVDAMQSSGGKLTLRTALSRSWAGQHEGIVITIADSGAGMSRETLRHIFEPFFSTKGATGTGLGLWVSREILIKHMGRIHVRSRPVSPVEGHPGWTVFRVFLPLSCTPALPGSGMLSAVSA